MTLLPTLASNTSIFLPTGELDENRAIDCVAGWISTAAPHGMEKKYGNKYGREWLQTELQDGLREGQLPVALYAVRLAEADDEICDAALRTVFAEMVGGAFPERKPGHLHAPVRIEPGI
jgi:hypothetical protein